MARFIEMIHTYEKTFKSIIRHHRWILASYVTFSIVHSHLMWGKSPTLHPIHLHSCFFFHLAFYSFKFLCFCFFNLYVKSFWSLFPYVLIHFGFLEFSHLQLLWIFFMFLFVQHHLVFLVAILLDFNSFCCNIFPSSSILIFFHCLQHSI
jgi:hypothetical protein